MFIASQYDVSALRYLVGLSRGASSKVGYSSLELKPPPGLLILTMYPFDLPLNFDLREGAGALHSPRKSQIADQRQIDNAADPLR